MSLVNFPCTVRLVRLIAPSLLMAISILSLIDCHNAFLDPNFMCIPVRPLNIYISPSEKHGMIKASHQADHSEFKTVVVFLFEIFAGLINFLTGGLYLLLTFSCITAKQVVDQTLGRRLRVPFPRKLDQHSPVQLVSFIEFSCFLAGVAGTFGTLMMITTMSLRYRSVGGQRVDSDDQIHVWNFSRLGVDQLRPPCHVYRTSGLTNAIIMLSADIILLTITILSKRVPVCEVQTSGELDNFNRTKTEEYSLLSTSNRAKKVACFCLDLTRLILMLASVLITCGGLNILGGALQLLQVDHSGLTSPYLVAVRSRLKEVFCIFNGILAMCCGIFSVTSIHCCSTPLEVLFSEVYELYGKSVPVRHRFGRFTHLLTISLGLVTLPISSGSYMLLRVDFTDYSRLDVAKEVKAPTVGVHTSEVLRVGYTLSCFASLIAFLVSAMLMVCLLVDVYLRIKLMDYHPSLPAKYTSHNRIDKALSESVNHVSSNTNHYFAHWKDAEQRSLMNKPQFDNGTLFEVENHLVPVPGSHRNRGDPGNSTLPMRNVQSGTLVKRMPVDQAAVAYPLPRHGNTVQLRAVTPHYLTPESHYSTELAFRQTGLGESIYHHPGGQNSLIYTCNNNNKTGGISSVMASTPTTTSFISPHQPIAENQDCVCEYMSCEIDCYPEATHLADPVAGIGITDPTVASHSPQPVWYYDIGTLAEGTFTSV